MASNPITTTNLQNYIPTVWSQILLADAESLLVMGARVDRRFEGYVKTGGDKIVVPHLAEISANVVNTAADMTLYDAVQNVTNISLNMKYDIGVLVDDINKLQTNPKYFDHIRSKMSYGLGKQVDANVAFLVNTFTQAVGTEGSALIEDNFMTAYEYVNLADAPDDDRSWVLDPESMTDLLKRDYFVRMDYVPEGVVSRGFTGRSIFGAPVYRTTNLTALNTNYHGACYLHREAIALCMQMEPNFRVDRIPLRHGDAIIGLCVYGTRIMRNTWGVHVKTRS